MKPGRAVGHLIAVFADLKFALAIGSANYQFGFTFFVWASIGSSRDSSSTWFQVW